jgi:ATP-dependent RNA helicase SUPV3L1/SUV3
LRAKEIHICGDATAVDLLEEMCLDTGDVFEVKKYNRLTPLKFLEKSLGNLNYVQPGDCIVCFNKKHIFQVVNVLQSLKKEFAIIYGSLPPSVKLAEAKRFNDPNNPCKILVATDAIGMVELLKIKIKIN